MINSTNSEKAKNSKAPFKSFWISLGVFIDIVIVLGIVFLLKETTNDPKNWYWYTTGAIFLLWLGFIAFRYLVYKVPVRKMEKNKEVNHHKMIRNAVYNKHLLNRLLIGAMLFIELIIVVGLVLIILTGDWKEEVFKIVSLALILVWVGILVGYYAWAVYFYNINLGLTNHDWAEIRAKNQHMPEGAIDVPSDNPNASQTLGLPPGTIRGTIALTLLIGGLAMAIAALGMNGEIDQDSFVVDHFDFFKTAFLMMIAFYFGNKALEKIGYKSLTGTNEHKGTNINNSEVHFNNTDPEPEIPASPVTTNAASIRKQLINTEDSGEIQSDSDTSPKDQNDFNDPNAIQ